MFLAYANQWVITPIIPLYVHDMGGSAFLAGAALLAFSVPSFVVRPFMGRLADEWGAAGVLASGLIVLAIGTSLLLAPFLAMVFVAGVARGIGWAGVNTGGYTTLAIAAPAQRRGEAAGYYTSVTTSASIVFPALGLWFIDVPGGYRFVFLLSTSLALMGLPVAMRLAQLKADAKIGMHVTGEPVHRALIDRGVLVATGLNLCSTLVMPFVMAFLPLYARSIGVENIGMFYVLAGVTSIIIRPVLGRRSDAMGRAPAIGFGLAAQAIGLLLIMIANGLPLILAGGFFLAVSWALIGSATMALAMDLANSHSRGQAMATFSMSYQLGSGCGAIIAGYLADLVGFRGMYAGSVAVTIAGFGLLVTVRKLLPRPAK
jgi:MFS family permease